MFTAPDADALPESSSIDQSAGEAQSAMKLCSSPLVPADTVQTSAGRVAIAASLGDSWDSTALKRDEVMEMAGLFSSQAIDENDPVEPFTLYGTV